MKTEKGRIVVKNCSKREKELQTYGEKRGFCIKVLFILAIVSVNEKKISKWDGKNFN